MNKEHYKPTPPEDQDLPGPKTEDTKTDDTAFDETYSSRTAPPTIEQPEPDDESASLCNTESILPLVVFSSLILIYSVILAIGKIVAPKSTPYDMVA